MMNVGIKVEVLKLAVVAEMQSPVIVVSTIGKMYTPQNNETFIPTNIISIAGHSISAINPQFLRGETVAVYA